MRKLFCLVSVLSLMVITLSAQTGISGVVKVHGTDNPLAGVTVTVLQQNLSTRTNASGEFTLTYLQSGNVDVQFSLSGYLPQIVPATLTEGKEVHLGVIRLQSDVQEEARQETILELSEADFGEDEGRASQSVSASLARGDVYLSQTAYSFSPMRFRLRGYEQEFESTYVNGVHFNSLDRGGFNFSSLGGLNDANRNKDMVLGSEATAFGYGNLGTTTNILNRAGQFAAGTRASIAYSNRAYKLRGQATYATGLLPGGWAFAASGVVRWADEGIVQGTFYNSAGYFLAAEKMLNTRHSLSLVTYGAPTQRAQQSAATQEVYDLAGSIYYNAYWGYQNGVKRNSRIVKSFDPTVIFSHDFRISTHQYLRSGLAYHYNMYSNSAIGFYNAMDPRPDYYRLMPGFATDANIRNRLTQAWKEDVNTRQIDWNMLYAANLRNNKDNPEANAKYMVERRHSNLQELAFNSTYVNQLTRALKITAGVQAKHAKDMNYKTMDDLLGANRWKDIDQFAERDFPTDNVISQNDLTNPNREIKKGDVFGYKYDINILHASAFLQNEWNTRFWDVYYAAQLTYTSFSRFGYMRNGRAPENSLGKANTWWFVDPSAKFGVGYKPNGRNRFYGNIKAETRAPLPAGAYVSERIKATPIPNLQTRKILSYDLNYAFTYPNVRGRMSLFQTHILGTSENLGYYDDGLRTFINHILTNSNKVYRGFEIGITGKISNSFSISATQTFADHRYTNDAEGIKSYENGSKPDERETVLTKGLKINTGPQLAANVTLDYFHPKMWFADITFNFFENNYLDFAPNRFTKSNMARYTTPELKAALGTQEKLKGGMLVDVSVGKVIYLPKRRSMNINLSFNNIFNNTKLITGGFQQARLLSNDDGTIDATSATKFSNKYYYAWGFNMFLNLGFRL